MTTVTSQKTQTMTRVEALQYWGPIVLRWLDTKKTMRGVLVVQKETCIIEDLDLQSDDLDVRLDLLVFLKDIGVVPQYPKQERDGCHRYGITHIERSFIPGALRQMKQAVLRFTKNHPVPSQRKLTSSAPQQDTKIVTQPLPVSSSDVSGQRVAISIPVDRITIQEQHRRLFVQESLESLAGSMETHGLFNPLHVRLSDTHEQDSMFVLVAGERRLRAARMLKWENIPCFVQQVKRTDRVWQLTENLQREDANPIELARGIRMIQESDSSLTIADIAQKLAKSEPWVYNKLRLFQLPTHIQEDVATGALAESTAMELLRQCENSEEVAAVYAEILEDLQGQRAGKSRVTAARVRRFVDERKSTRVNAQQSGLSPFEVRVNKLVKRLPTRLEAAVEILREMVRDERIFDQVYNQLPARTKGIVKVLVEEIGDHSIAFSAHLKRRIKRN